MFLSGCCAALHWPLYSCMSRKFRHCQMAELVTLRLVAASVAIPQESGTAQVQRSHPSHRGQEHLLCGESHSPRHDSCTPLVELPCGDFPSRATPLHLVSVPRVREACLSRHSHNEVVVESR